MQELGSGNTATVVRRRPHIVAGFFYLVLAVGGIGAAVTGQPIGLVATALALPYAIYLFRGGSFVLWIW